MNMVVAFVVFTPTVGIVLFVCLGLARKIFLGVIFRKLYGPTTPDMWTACSLLM